MESECPNIQPGNISTIAKPLKPLLTTTTAAATASKKQDSSAGAETSAVGTTTQTWEPTCSSLPVGSSDALSLQELGALNSTMCWSKTFND